MPGDAVQGWQDTCGCRDHSKWLHQRLRLCSESRQPCYSLHNLGQLFFTYPFRLHMNRRESIEFMYPPWLKSPVSATNADMSLQPPSCRTLAGFLLFSSACMLPLLHTLSESLTTVLLFGKNWHRSIFDAIITTDVFLSD